MGNQSQEATRERLIAVAAQEFSARGFYGASIAQIAGELGLSKQALLYHFKRKEDLYAEVLKGIANRLLQAMQDSVDAAAPEIQQLEDMFLTIFEAAVDNPLGTRVLMREMLDNQRRDVPPDQWYLKRFLEELASKLGQAGNPGELDHAKKIARVYLILSSIEYFAASADPLRRFYGEEEYDRIRDAYRAEFQAQLRRLLDAPHAA